MRYADLTIQTLIFIFGIVMLIWLRNDPAFPMGPLLTTQLILGPWQLLSSIVSVIARSNFHRARRIHLLFACFYLLILYACLNSTLPVFRHSGIVIKLLLTIPAWALAFYYYIITWKCVWAAKKNRGNFLPNLSF